MLPEGEGHARVAAIDELGLDRDFVRLKPEALGGGIAIDLIDPAVVEGELSALGVSRGDAPC
jgi:hypothetical protein